jgi:hemerythrin superfamily protein
MDALELLKADHRKVQSLFAEAQNARDGTQKWHIFVNIKQALLKHAHAEETVFYPMFRRYDEFEGLISKSFEEHAEMKRLLAEFTDMAGSLSGFDEMLSQLIAAVSAHIEVEENELFPKVRQLLKRSEREQIGRHLQTAENEIAAEIQKRAA